MLLFAQLIDSNGGVGCCVELFKILLHCNKLNLHRLGENAVK
jgi:hypothetical protein